MPWELIYTSAPRGLAFGQSGFCTVARTSNLREALVQRLEQISAYQYLHQGTSTTLGKRNPTIFAYRILDIRGTKFHVLSRILPCGVDFTARTNHLAHHLIFGPEELENLPSPAAILRHWTGWRSDWQGEPHLLDPLPAGTFNLLPPPVWPAETWRQVTGDAGRAAGLLEAEYTRGCYLLAPPGGEPLLLNLFCETLQLLAPANKYQQRAWLHTFTTYLQGEDVASDFQWRGCQEGTPACEQALRRSATVVPIKAVRIPNNPLAKLASEGPKLPPAPSPTVTTPGLRTPLSINRSTIRNQPSLPGQRELARHKSHEGTEDDSYSWNISLSVKSLVGIGIAVVILAVLLVAKHNLWSGNHPLASKLPGATPAGPMNTEVPIPPAQVMPPEVPVPLPVVNPAPSHSNPPEANQKLPDVLPEMSTYLFVVPALSKESISLAGVPPLVKLLQRFERIDVTPADLEMRCAFNSWGASPKFPLSGDSDPHKQQLRLGGAGENQVENEFFLDYSSLPERASGQETIGLQARFDQEQLPSLSSFYLAFKTAASTGLIRGTKFEPFGLLVINAGNPPPPLKLSKSFLQVNRGNLDLTFRQPLGERLKLLHLGALVWQLHPYVFTTNASGVPISEDLYKLLPLEVQPSLGCGLEFAEVGRVLAQKRQDQSSIAEHCKQELQQQASTLVPVVDWNLQIGAFLGLTNQQLICFNAFLAQKQEQPSSEHFLNYLRRLAESAKAQQTWLDGWVDTPSETTPQRLQSFFNLWAANLPPDTTAALTVTNGPTIGNYFVSGWGALKWTEDIERKTKEKEKADRNVERWQQLSGLIPYNLDQVASVHLFLVDPNTQLEVIQFTDLRHR